MNHAVKIIVFSDLDGTLLNSHDYSFEEARPTLDLLRQRQIPLIFCTSKTRHEVEQIRKKLSIADPFIVENGGGIFFKPITHYTISEPTIEAGEYLMIQLGQNYNALRHFINLCKGKFKIEGFGDWTVARIAELTGLKHDEAVLAKEREFTEPFLIHKTEDLHKLKSVAKQAKLKIVQGGRFFHLIGENQDKGKAVEITKGLYGHPAKAPVFSIGLGDSENDIPMLESVDIPVLIPHPDGSFEKFERPNLVKAIYRGSKGWNEALKRVLDGFS